jgi:hypothetical protein
MKEIKGLDVKIWLIKHGLTQKAMANGYGCSELFVSCFVRGERTSNGMAEYFINKGCPKEYFKNGRVAA